MDTCDDSFTTYSVKEVSVITRIPERTIRYLVQHDYIRSFLPNGCVRGRRVTEAELRRWMNEREKEAATHER